MGYITRFDITLVGEEQKVEAFKKDLLETSAYADGDCDEDVIELLDCNYVCAKLYELEEYIDDVAPRHPDVLVILDGDGEESSDKWQCRWKGNKREKHYAIIPPFTIPELFTEDEKTK